MVYLLAYIIVLFFKKTTSKSNFFFMLYLPIIDSLYNMLPGRGIDNHFIPPIIIILIFLNIKKGSSKYLLSAKLMTVFLFLLFFSLVFSSDLMLSLKHILGFTAALLCFPIFFILSKKINFKEKHIFMRNIGISVIMYISSIAFFSLIGYGRNYYYSESIVHLGRFGFSSLYPFMIMLVFIINMYKFEKSKISYLLLFITGFIILMIIAKRSYIYPVLIGALIVFLPLSKRKRILSVIIVSMIFIVLNIGIIQSYFLEIRGSDITSSYLKQNRYLEFVNYKYEVIDKFPVHNILFGTEIFNSAGKFFWKYKIIDDPGERILHSDYVHILYGVGIVGIIIYLLFLIYIIKDFIKIRLRYKKANTLFFVSIFFVVIMGGLSDGALYFSNRIFYFAFLGYIIGLPINTNLMKIKKE